MNRSWLAPLPPLVAAAAVWLVPDLPRLARTALAVVALALVVRAYRRAERQPAHQAAAGGTAADRVPVQNVGSDRLPRPGRGTSDA